jgi:hypothetical protein
LPRLNIIYYGNPIEYVPLNLLRRIENVKTGQNIYGDSQNVHNSNIQLCVKKSLNYLLKEPVVLNLTFNELQSELQNECLVHEILLDFCKDESVHSILNVTFKEILIAVWSKIRGCFKKK